MKPTRAPIKLFSLVLTIAAAVAIGFGVPLGWIWIGSQIEGSDGASTVSFSAAMAVLFGIIFTYVALGWIAGWVQARFERPDAGGGPPPSARHPWMQSQGDTRGRSGPGGGPQSELRPLETVFVTTTIIVTAAFFVWFALFAEGGGLPNP